MLTYYVDLLCFLCLTSLVRVTGSYTGDDPKLQGSLLCLHFNLTFLPWGWSWVGMEIFRDHTHTQYSSLGSGISGEFYLTFLCASRYAGVCLYYASPVGSTLAHLPSSLFYLLPYWSLPYLSSKLLIVYSSSQGLPNSQDVPQLPSTYNYFDSVLSTLTNNKRLSFFAGLYPTQHINSRQ